MQEIYLNGYYMIRTYFHEYNVKLDSYYYDRAQKKTIVVIRVRHKRTTYKMPINHLLGNKKMLSCMHPVDIFIVGILMSSPTTMQQDSNIFNISDDFIMTKMEPLLEVISRDFNNNEEMVTFRLKMSGKSVAIKSSELTTNNKILNAIKYQDALSLGVSAGYDSYHSMTFVKDLYDFKSYFLINNSIFIAFIFLSVFLSNNIFYLHIFQFTLPIHGYTIFLPAIFMTMTNIIKTESTNDANAFFMVPLCMVAICFMYYYFIVNMPVPEGDIRANQFNKFFNSIQENSFCYIISLASLFFLSTVFSDNAFSMLFASRRSIYFFIRNCLTISIFFVVFEFVSKITMRGNIFKCDYIYMLIVSNSGYFLFIFLNRFKYIRGV